MIGTTPHERAYIGPFFLFLAFLLFTDLVGKLDAFSGHWVVTSSKYWVYPVQTVACAVALWHRRQIIVMGPWRGMGFATFAGMLSLIVWIAPQQWLGFPPRTAGFDPAFFADGGWQFWLNVIGRMLRMVVIVPLVEEIFWRGFLLRYFVDDEFERVPFGEFTWKSFAIVSVAFCFEHQMADWTGALITSVLFNLVAYRTKSLAACVVAHAVTNLGLGIYILRTGQNGFW
jgi:uncharacterized protein